MPLISIIVPIYKVKEKYLRTCLDSLVNQTFINIEIILINDGTPDNGGQICEEYKKKDARVRVIHQKNQGVSVARNNGLKIATGKWITFVDADDWIEFDTCEILKNVLLETDLDFLIFGLKVNLRNKEIENPFWDKEKTYIDKNARNELQIQLLHKKESKYNPPYNTISVVSCKIYKKSFLEKYNIKFNTDLVLSEDGVFIFQALESAEKIMYLNKFLYHYRKHNESATNKYRENAIIDYSEGLKIFKKKLIKYRKSERFYEALNYRIILNIYAITNQYYCNNKNDMSYFKKIQGIKKLSQMEPYFSAIKTTTIRKYYKNSSYFDRIRFFLLKFKSYRLYYCLFIFKRRIKS